MPATLSGDTGLTAPQGAVYNGLQSATAQATTSGTSITFSSIPSWVKRITVMFNGVSTSGTSQTQIQLGSGSVTTTGYTSTSFFINNTTPITASLTSGFLVYGDNAAYTRTGIYTIDNLSGNLWVFSGNHLVSTTQSTVGMGQVTLAGTLDRVVLTTVNGTDTFDAGSVNIIYE